MEIADDSKLSKIEKLLRKAERAGTPEEGETFFAKAQELMAKWSIDAAMLAAAGTGEVQKVIRDKIVINKSGLWKANLTLLMCMALPNNVKIVVTQPYMKGDKPIAHLIGFPGDVEMTKMLYASMQLQNVRMRRQMMPDSYRGDQKVAVPWMRSFIEAFAYRIKERLIAAKTVAEDAATTEYGSSNLLPVLASKSQKVTEALGEFFPHLGQMKSDRSKRDYAGMDAGRRAADNADIGQKRMGGRKAIG